MALDAAPILDHLGTPSPSGSWYYVNVYWDTAGAKPLWGVAEYNGGSFSNQISRADLAAGYVTVGYSGTTGTQFQIYPETRKGVHSNSQTVTVP